MGTGISMSSVNKIKELAANGDYSLALDILEHQDLTKSLSPQFIKVCGEVYYENGRYDTARAALVKAHSMAPMGNKIIFSLIKVYLASGFYSLAETYYEIYKFNQNEKDAGTYRIEYMIAKAHRKPVKELYSILISANEIETDAYWSFEMLMLYAGMGNKEKFKTESEIFCAEYKSSPYVEKVNQIKNGKFNLKENIYCYPESEQADDDVNQQKVRDFEKKVLEKDDLRLHPKDPKITLMFADDEPVSSSAKFRQMLVVSRDKKELKKQAKEEKKDGQNVMGFLKKRISKKDEKAVQDMIAETEENPIDKEKLLDEVMNTDSDDASKEDTAENNVPENVFEIGFDKTVSEENEDNEKNDLDMMSEKDFDEDIDNFEFQQEDDVDAVIMVGVEDIETVEEVEATEIVENDEIVEEVEETETVEEVEETETVEETEETETVEEVEETETVEEAEETETVEEVEETGTVEEVEETETVEETEETKADEEEVVETDEVEVVGEVEKTENTEADDRIEESEDASFDIDEAMQSLEEYDISQEYEPEAEAEPGTEVEAEPDVEPEREAEAEPEPEREAEVEPEPEPEPEQEVEVEPDVEPERKTVKNDFPVFKSSLFPDYNRDEPPVTVRKKEKNNEEFEKADKQMEENLKKEEQLISETDELLARLGIELGTKYSGNTDFFNLHGNKD